MFSNDHSRRYSRLDSSNGLNFCDYKIVVLGAATVGKSSVTIRFVNKNFSEEYNPTLQDKFRKVVYLDGQSSSLEILDTAGMEDYIVMQNHWIREGKGFVVMYAVNNQDSFDEVKRIRQKIERERNSKDVPMILVGNKCDLENQRVISKEQGRNLANLFKCLFIESSAKEGLNCEQVFLDVVRHIRQIEEPKQPVKKQKRNFKQWLQDTCVLI